VPISKSATAQKECVKLFHDVVDRFTDPTRTYNPNSTYWKKMMITHFPRKNDITPEEFFKKDIEYQKNSQYLFYQNRKTYWEKQEEEKQGKLFSG